MRSLCSPGPWPADTAIFRRVSARLSCKFFCGQQGACLVLSRFIEIRLGTDRQRGMGTIPLVRARAHPVHLTCACGHPLIARHDAFCGVSGRGGSGGMGALMAYPDGQQTTVVVRVLRLRPAAEVGLLKGHLKRS